MKVTGPGPLHKRRCRSDIGRTATTAAIHKDMVMEKCCLRCKYYKMKDPENGFCRLPEKEPGSAPVGKRTVRSDHLCGKWIDCGQQYYIRIGWIKAYAAREAGTGAS